VVSLGAAGILFPENQLVLYARPFRRGTDFHSVGIIRLVAAASASQFENFEVTFPEKSRRIIGCPPENVNGILRGAPGEPLRCQSQIWQWCNNGNPTTARTPHCQLWRHGLSCRIQAPYFGARYPVFFREVFRIAFPLSS
jgi:hypothetical protein